MNELHGVVMDAEHVALAWCVRFAGHIISSTDGLTAFQRAFQRTSHARAMLSAWREQILHLEASKKKIQITDKFLDGVCLGHKRKFLVSSSLEHLLIVWCAELSSDGLVKTPQIQSFSTAFVDHPGDLCQMTNHVNPENCESNR